MHEVDMAETLNILPMELPYTSPPSRLREVVPQ